MVVQGLLVLVHVPVSGNENDILSRTINIVAIICMPQIHLDTAQLPAMEQMAVDSIHVDNRSRTSKVGREELGKCNSGANVRIVSQNYKLAHAGIVAWYDVISPESPLAIT